METNQLFKEQSIIALATVSRDHTPNLRYVEHQFTIDDRIYFATSNQGSAYTDLATNNNIVIMQFDQGLYTRVKGQVSFLAGAEREQLKNLVNQKNPKIAARYGDDGFDKFIEVGYITNPSIDVRDMRQK